MIAKVVHCKLEKYDVYVGRPSKFGNPFSHKNGTLAKFKVKTREEAIEKYREWVMQQPELIKIIKKELANKVLSCFCKPLPCHGDILLEIANEKEENK